MRSVRRLLPAQRVYVGKDGNLLEQNPENCKVLKINNPILTNTDMLKIKEYESRRLQGGCCLHYFITRAQSWRRAIDRLFVEVDRAYRDGANILMLSDRGVDENHMPIPSLLAVSAVASAPCTDEEEYFCCY